MTIPQSLPHKPLTLTGVLLVWLLVAIAIGCTFALTGIASIVVAMAVALLIVFGSLAANFPSLTMSISICFLAFVPYNAGLQTGVLPKLFGEEASLVAYLCVFPFLYLLSKRSWEPGFAGLYGLLFLLLGAQALSFTVHTDILSARNFIETYVLAAMLLVVFLQESSNAKPDLVGRFAGGLTVALGLLTILERITLKNPIWEHDPNYLSPALSRLTHGFYRPYVTFFHPSEAGTFMALGLPFLFWSWREKRSPIILIGIFIAILGLLINSTRGVWVGVLVAGLLEVRGAWLLISAFIPVGAVAAGVSYLALKSTAFMQRLTDPNDLYSRIECWKIAGRILMAHPLLGVGHQQYGTVYQTYIQDVSNLGHFDLANIAVADNAFVTTAADHGMIGLLSMLLFFLACGLLLRKFRKTLTRGGLISQARLVRCSELALVIYLVTGCFADVHLFTKSTKYLFILMALGLAAGARYSASLAVSPHTDAQAGEPVKVFTNV